MPHWNLALAVLTGLGLAAALIALCAAACAMAERATVRKLQDDFPGFDPEALPPARWDAGRRVGLGIAAAAALAAALVVAWGPVGPRPPADRSEFGYAAGRFVRVDDRKWVERRDAGTASGFVETDRCLEYIQLYDAHRGLAVRLYGDRAAAYRADGEAWIGWPGSDGRWL